jgi:hypothetical protein
MQLDNPNPNPNPKKRCKVGATMTNQGLQTTPITLIEAGSNYFVLQYVQWTQESVGFRPTTTSTHRDVHLLCPSDKSSIESNPLDLIVRACWRS